MEKIAAFRTSDGQIFTDENLAIQHEANIKLENDIAVLVEKFNERQKTLSCEPVDVYDVSRFIMENQREICLLLDSTIIDKEVLAYKLEQIFEDGFSISEPSSEVHQYILGVPEVVEKILKLF